MAACHGKNIQSELGERIRQAKTLSEGMNIDYYALSTEAINFPNESFDVITACQCFFYFDHEQVMPRFYRMLKPDGRILVLYMAWLPFEDRIAGASEGGIPVKGAFYP